MAEDYLERVAGELAEMAIADEKRSGDDKIIPEIGEVLGASSQTLQEAFLTAVRVRRAEIRARAILADRAAVQIVEDTPIFQGGERGQAANPAPATPAEPEQSAQRPQRQRADPDRRGDLDTVEDATFEDVAPSGNSDDAPQTPSEPHEPQVRPVRPRRQ